MPVRWKAVDFVKRLAKGPLAYLKRSAQGRNVQWLVYMGEGQSLSLFDDIAPRVAFPSERGFRNDCEPLMNVHQKSPVERARQIGFTGHTTHDRCWCDIVLWGNRRFSARARGPGGMSVQILSGILG